MSWGSWGQWANTALQVGATVYAANQANEGAESAANAAGQASADTNALNKYIYDDQRNLAMPGYQRGEWAANTLASYLGMPAGYGGGTQAYGGTQSAQVPTQWFGDGTNRNEALYASDPLYRQAWDEVAAYHQQKYGKGYTNDSDRGALSNHMAQVYRGLQSQQAASQPAQATPTTAQPRSALYDMFRQQPGYQFGLDEGRKTVEAGAAARGGLNSGATLKALTKYGQDYADAKGWQPYLNQLQSMAGLSQTASAQIGSAGQNYASAVGQSNWNAAEARGQSAYQRGQNNAWLAGQIGSIGSDLYGAYQQRNGGY